MAMTPLRRLFINLNSPIHPTLIAFLKRSPALLHKNIVTVSEFLIDHIVYVSHSGIGFNSDRNAVTIVTAEDTIDVGEAPKLEVAQKVLDAVVRIRQAKSKRSLAKAIDD